MLWLALHAFLFAVTGGDIVALAAQATIGLALIGAIVGHADTSRRHEYGMLGNLGVSRNTPAAMWAGTMVLLEIVLRVQQHFAA
jgi:hypothetical protein